MAHVGTAVEYGLHCLLFLVGSPAGAPGGSARDLADLQGVPPEYVAKVFTRLEKAGLVAATEGARGGFRLARAAEQVTVLDVVDAIEGDKPLFECQQIRGRCALFGGEAPAWATRGVCAIHAVMLEAEKRMREALASHTLADLAARTAAKAPPGFTGEAAAWLEARKNQRPRGRRAVPPPSDLEGEPS